MAVDGNLPYRRSLRLSGYDYSEPGYYFVTICIQDPAILLSEVFGGAVVLTPAGRMVSDEWLSLRGRFAELGLDDYVVMPDHFHGIAMLRDTTVTGRTNGQNDGFGGQRQALPLQKSVALPRVIQAFKSATTNAYIHSVETMGWKPFDTRLWQRNYYERIIRGSHELAVIRQYIRLNPKRIADNSP